MARKETTKLYGVKCPSTYWICIANDFSESHLIIFGVKLNDVFLLLWNCRLSQQTHCGKWLYGWSFPFWQRSWYIQYVRRRCYGAGVNAPSMMVMLVAYCVKQSHIWDACHEETLHLKFHYLRYDSLSVGSYPKPHHWIPFSFSTIDIVIRPAVSCCYSLFLSDFRTKILCAFHLLCHVSPPPPIMSLIMHYRGHTVKLLLTDFPCGTQLYSCNRVYINSVLLGCEPRWYSQWSRNCTSWAKWALKLRGRYTRNRNHSICSNNSTVIRYIYTQTCGSPFTCFGLFRPSSERYSTRKNNITKNN
jgi:hypothetical protein